MNKEILKKACISFWVYICASVFINGILGFVAMVIGIKDGILYDLVMLFSATLTFFVLLLYSKDNLNNQINNFKKDIGKNLKIIFKTWILGFTLMIITNFIINMFFMHSIAPNEEANREILFQYPIYSIVYMCFLAPIMEEVLFRLNLKDIFKGKNAYILTSGLLFGFMHVLFGFSLENLIYLIPYSILGFTFAKIFYETDSVVSSSIAHIIHNSLSVIVIFFGV